MHWIDYLVLAGYVSILGIIVWKSRPATESSDDYFLAGRNIPWWAAALSFMATALSAATFVGVPQLGYTGNLTYLAANIGAFIAIALVAFLFVPAFYRTRVRTVYEYLGLRFGSPAATAASITFLLGRILASGVRLYIAAAALTFLFAPNAYAHDPTLQCLTAVLLVLTAIVAVSFGGMRCVIWTDVCQAGIFIIAALASIVTIYYLLPEEASISNMVTTLESHDKLTIFDTSFWAPDENTGAGFFAEPFTLLAIICGMTLINMGAYGTDQDLAQRLLTCSDQRAGSRSAIAAVIIAIPVTFLFICVGFMLWLYYQQSPALGGSTPEAIPADSKDIYLFFILNSLPSGLSGLTAAGLLAATVSSLTSELNAMSSTFVTDCFKPWSKSVNTDTHEIRLGRYGVVLSGLCLAGFASYCVYTHSDEDVSIISLALGIMTFAYSGLVGIFLCALLSKRGNSLSAICALLVGFISIWTMKEYYAETFSFTWQMFIAVGLCFLVCFAGTPYKANKDA